MKRIARKALDVDAHEDVATVPDVTHDQRSVLGAIDEAAKADDRELAVLGG
jgi:hypothetical protein